VAVLVAVAAVVGVDVAVAVLVAVAAVVGADVGVAVLVGFGVAEGGITLAVLVSAPTVGPGPAVPVPPPIMMPPMPPSSVGTNVTP
jgi:hypothetical protein